MSIKSKELAALIGVSEATVSLVLNGKPGISDKTRKKVIWKIKELGYEELLKNQSASGNHNLCFIVYKDGGMLLGENSFFPLILDGIEQTARKYGYSLTIANVDKQHLEEDIEHIREEKYSGFIIFATEMHENELPLFEKLGIPFVVFDNCFPDRDLTYVKVNNEQGTYRVIKYLYEKGHRKVGYLSSGLEITSFKERRARTLDAMQSFGMEDCENYVYAIGYPHEVAEKGMDDVLKRYKKEELPTAFVADNDLVAVGAMSAIKKIGYRIPDDFSVIGFDDRPICTMVEPKLTTVHLPRHRFGSETVEQLIRIIEKGLNDSEITVQVNGHLVERNSVLSR